MRYNSRGDSLAGFAGVTSAEITEEGVIIKGEPDGVKVTREEAARFAAFLTDGDNGLFEHDEKVAKEAAEQAASDAAVQIIEDARKGPLDEEGAGGDEDEAPAKSKSLQPPAAKKTK